MEMPWDRRFGGQSGAEVPPRARLQRRPIPLVLLGRVALLLALLFLPWSRAATVELLILHTADIHARIGPGAAAEEGDWLRLATVIRDQRRRSGADRTLLIDCGDTISGSFIAAHTRGEPALALLRNLAYDVWVPGNHEFDFGVRRLLEVCRTPGLPVVCGNLTLSAEGATHAFPPWLLLRRGGAQVAVIGVTATYLDNWLFGRDQEGYRVESAAALVERVLPEIMRQRPDAVILAAHHGWAESDPRGINEVRAIAARFPEIDLVLGAHTHRLIQGMRLGRETWYVQPGALATHVAAIRLVVDTKRHRVVDASSELLPAADAPDPAATAAVAEAMAEARQAAAKPVCDLPEVVSAGGTPGVSCAVSELLCRALVQATGATIALHGRLSRVDLPAGTVTEADLFAVVPYENAIVVAELTPAELECVVAEQLANRTSYVYCGVFGAEFVLQAPAPAEAVGAKAEDRDYQAALPTVRMRHPPKAGERLLVALNSYTAAGGGGRFPELRRILRTPEARVRDTQLSARAVLRDYLRSNAQEPIKPRRWIQGRLTWADAPSRGAPE